MSVKSIVYLNDARPLIREIERIIEKEGYKIEDIDVETTNHYVNGIKDFEFEYAYFYFGNGDYIQVFPYNAISGGERDKTEPYTISGHTDSFTCELLKKIASYYGGHFKENDNEVWIPKSNVITQDDALAEFIYSKIDYGSQWNCRHILDFIKKNKLELKKLLEE